MTFGGGVTPFLTILKPEQINAAKDVTTHKCNYEMVRTTLLYRPTIEQFNSVPVET